MELVKQKAKAEMAQLERELMSVISAMENASLSENLAVAVSQVSLPRLCTLLIRFITVRFAVCVLVRSA